MKNNKKQRIWINVSETINIGNYNSVKVEAGYSKFYDTENPNQMIDSDMDALLDVIRKKAKKIRKNKKE